MAWLVHGMHFRDMCQLMFLGLVLIRLILQICGLGCQWSRGWSGDQNYHLLERVMVINHPKYR